MLSLPRCFSRLWLLHFAHPACDRVLWKALHARPIRSVVEIGIDNIPRTRRLWDALAWRDGNLPLCYTAIDAFESRPAGRPPLPLKQAHSALRREGVQVKLIPGDVSSALARSANSLTGTDLLLISAGLDGEQLAKAWPWMPRMLHAGTIIFQEEMDAAGTRVWRRLSIVEIQQRAAAAKGKRKAA